MQSVLLLYIYVCIQLQQYIQFTVQQNMYHSHISFLSSNYLDGDNSAKNIQVARMMPPRDLFDFPEPRRQREQLTIQPLQHGIGLAPRSTQNQKVVKTSKDRLSFFFSTRKSSLSLNSTMPMWCINNQNGSLGCNHLSVCKARAIILC